MFLVTKLRCSLFIIGLTVVSVVNAQSQDGETTQKELDATCESAREIRLTESRTKHIEECVENKKQQDRAACERYYSNYGARAGARPPMYYDLPECEKAFEHQRSQRSR